MTRASAPRIHIRRDNRSRGVNLALWTLALACIAWSITLGVEVWRDRDVSGDTSSQDAAQLQEGDALLRLDDGDDLEPVADSSLLPSSLDGWIVQGVQPVPGSDGSVIEGNYTPQDEKRSLVMPLVVYVQVATVPEGRQTPDWQSVAARYTEDVEERLLAGNEVYTGRTADGGSYFVGWVREGRIYGVDATFRYRIPASGGRPVIRKAAEEVAQAVMKHRPGQGGSE